VVTDLFVIGQAAGALQNSFMRTGSKPGRGIMVLYINVISLTAVPYSVGGSL
jgi:hypothetical protein